MSDETQKPAEGKAAATAAAKTPSKEVMTVKHNAQKHYEENVGKKINVRDRVTIKFDKAYLHMKEGEVLVTNQAVADIYCKQAKVATVVKTDSAKEATED